MTHEGGQTDDALFAEVRALDNPFQKSNSYVRSYFMLTPKTSGHESKKQDSVEIKKMRLHQGFLCPPSWSTWSRTKEQSRQFHGLLQGSRRLFAKAFLLGYLTVAGIRTMDRHQTLDIMIFSSAYCPEARGERALFRQTSTKNFYNSDTVASLILI
jgi:hypothetical protein